MAQAMTGKQIAEFAAALISVINVETRLLDERAPERLLETQERKQALMDDYRNGINLLRAGKLPLTSAERDLLKKTGKQLESRMVGHARRIARMKSITEGLIHVVAETANAKTAPVNAYGASGQSQAASIARNAYRKPAALSVNRMI